MANPHLHPAVDNGIQAGQSGFTGGTLVCKCTNDTVAVEVDNEYLFNHLCGCTQCWKPQSAMFSMLAAVPREKVNVTKHEEKLHIENPDALLHRYACKDCGTHMYGVIEKSDHVFHPFAFIHPELSQQTGFAAPTFAAFVSSVIESGVQPDQMENVRSRLKDLGVASYDCYSPELMDIIATHAAKASGVVPA